VIKPWTESVLPRLTHATLDNGSIRRARLAAILGMSGEVVEIGFGSGLNVELYPPEVTTVYAVEPSALARKMAAQRVEESRVRIEFTGLDGQNLPLADASVDAALSTFTLCTIPEAELALSELRRVVRPGGRFHFLEHGLAPGPSTAKWQQRLNPLQRRVAGGCNLNRKIDILINDNGFVIERLEVGYLAGPKPMRPWGYLYSGVAVRSD